MEPEGEPAAHPAPARPPSGPHHRPGDALPEDGHDGDVHEHRDRRGRHRGGVARDDVGREAERGDDLQQPGEVERGEQHAARNTVRERIGGDELLGRVELGAAPLAASGARTARPRNASRIEGVRTATCSCSLLGASRPTTSAPAASVGSSASATSSPSGRAASAPSASAVPRAAGPGPDRRRSPAASGHVSSARYRAAPDSPARSAHGAAATTRPWRGTHALGARLDGEVRARVDEQGRPSRRAAARARARASRRPRAGRRRQRGPAARPSGRVRSHRDVGGHLCKPP